MIDNENDGWETIDTSNPNPTPQTEAPEIEIEGQPEAAPEETPVVSAEPEIIIDDDNDEVQEAPPEEEAIKELSGIKTKGAEKRIRKLVAQRKERDEQLALALEKIKYLESTLSDKDKNISDYRRQSIDSKKEETKRRVEAAQASFAHAFDEGNKETLVQAQSDLAEAQAELKIIELTDNMNTQEVPSPVEREVAAPVRQQPQTTQFDEGAVEWAKKNEWFGKDKVGTSIALAVDQSLKEEGFDPRDDDFYEELDKRLSNELPSRLRPSSDEKPTQVVAGQSRRQAPSNKVRLTQDDVSLAKKWGIPLERYAAEKKKAERSAGDYTTIR